MENEEGENGEGDSSEESGTRKEVLGSSVNVVTVRSRLLTWFRPFRFLFWRADIYVAVVGVVCVALVDVDDDERCVERGGILKNRLPETRKTLSHEYFSVLYLLVIPSSPPQPCPSLVSTLVRSTARQVRLFFYVWCCSSSTYQIGVARNRGIDIIVNEVSNRATPYVHLCDQRVLNTYSPQLARRLWSQATLHRRARKDSGDLQLQKHHRIPQASRR